MSTFTFKGGTFYGAQNMGCTQSECSYTYNSQHQPNNRNNEQTLEVQSPKHSNTKTQSIDNSKYVVNGGEFHGTTQIGDGNIHNTHIHIHINDPKAITQAIQSLSKSNTSTDTTNTYQIETALNCKKRPHSITRPNDNNTPNRKKRKLRHNFNDIDGIPLTCNKLDTIDINNKWNDYNKPMIGLNLFNDNNIQNKSNCINSNNNNNNNSIVEQLNMYKTQSGVIGESHSQQSNRKLHTKYTNKIKKKGKSKVTCNVHQNHRVNCHNCSTILNKRIEALGLLNNEIKQKIRDDKVMVKLSPQQISKYDKRKRGKDEYLICSCYVKLDDNKKEENKVTKNKKDRFYICEICGKGGNESKVSKCVLKHLRIYVRYQMT